MLLDPDDVAAGNVTRFRHSLQPGPHRPLPPTRPPTDRHSGGIHPGPDPAALVEAINDAQAQRAAARAEIDGTTVPGGLTKAEVHAMIDSLGDVSRALRQADPAGLEQLYEALRLEMIYDAPARALDVTVQPTPGVSVRVRGPT